MKYFGVFGLGLKLTTRPQRVPRCFQSRLLQIWCMWERDQPKHAAQAKPGQTLFASCGYSECVVGFLVERLKFIRVWTGSILYAEPPQCWFSRGTTHFLYLSSEWPELRNGDEVWGTTTWKMYNHTTAKLAQR